MQIIPSSYFLTLNSYVPRNSYFQLESLKTLLISSKSVKQTIFPSNSTLLKEIHKLDIKLDYKLDRNVRHERLGLLAQFGWDLWCRFLIPQFDITPSNSFSINQISGSTSDLTGFLNSPECLLYEYLKPSFY